MDLVSNKTTDLAILTELTAADGVFDGAKIALYQNDVTPTPLTVIGGLTEATYTGYAQKAIVWAAPSDTAGGTAEVIGTIAAAFRPTATTTGNVIYGLMIVTAGGALLLSARLDESRAMAETLDYLNITIRLRLTQDGLAVSID
jgi:hypothetical protein